MKILLTKILSLFTKSEEKINFAPPILYQRLYVVIIVFFMAFAAVSSKLIKVSLSNKSSFKYSEQIVNARNEIVDRNGSLIAVDLEIVSLYANPKIIFNPSETAKELCKIFPNLNKQELTKQLQSKKSFTWVKRNITPKQQYQVNNLGIPGLEFESGTKRVYTQGSLFSHVIGYVDTDGNGIAGIEKQFDKKLKDPKSGKLQLSLDTRVQNIVHTELAKSIKEYNALGGIGVVMDANNGEIISMVSMPDFDPHYPGDSTKEELFNQCSLGIYEMGSIMKGLTIAMGLDSKAVSLNDVYAVKEPIKASRFVIHDYRPKRTHLSVPGVFMYSSNIGTAMISLEVGKEKQIKFLKNFGLFDELKIELPEKGKPMYPHEKNWSDVSTMTISFGHGMAVSALHFVRASAALVNGGLVHEPTLFIKDKNLVNKQATRVLSEETSQSMRKLMRLTVEHGTGRKAEAKGYLVGGKTGSAEKAVRGGYSKKHKRSAFFAAFPINNPRYVTLIILDDPQPNKNTPFSGGGWTAAPLTGKIISRIAPMLNVQPINHEDPAIKKELWVDFDPEHTEKLEKSF